MKREKALALAAWLGEQASYESMTWPDKMQESVMMYKAADALREAVGEPPIHSESIRYEMIRAASYYGRPLDLHPALQESNE